MNTNRLLACLTSWKNPWKRQSFQWLWSWLKKLINQTNGTEWNIFTKTQTSSVVSYCLSNFPASICSLVELSADSESQKLPSQSLSNLAQLSLVCLKHSTVFEAYSGDFSSGGAEMETHLFEAVVEFLLTWKAVANAVLYLLLRVLSGNVIHTWDLFTYRMKRSRV